MSYTIKKNKSNRVKTIKREKQHLVNNEKKQYNSKFCDSKMTFEECEMTILRHYIEKNDNLNNIDKIENFDSDKLFNIVENFLRRKKLVCYGGTAINNILPKKYQFYGESDIPDYDFYSTHPLEDTIELTNIIHKAKFEDIEAKSGVHRGTFRIFVNHIPAADITLIESKLFHNIQKDAIIKDGIYYAPPNILRMNSYIELSRPQGFVQRWEKVLPRLNLLNQFYPLQNKKSCKIYNSEKNHWNEEKQKIIHIVKDILIHEKVIFFGGYAASFFSNYIHSKREQNFIYSHPNFDAIVTDAKKTAGIIKEKLQGMGVNDVQVNMHSAVDQIIPVSYEIVIQGYTLAFLYETAACYNYNRVKIGDNKMVNIATIDTILSFYLAFYYADKPFYSKERIMCLAQFLFDVQKKTRLLQSGILKRFNSSCKGTQTTLISRMKEKSALFKTYSNKRKDKEYDMNFFKYIPGKELK